MPGANNKPPTALGGGLDVQLLEAPTQFSQFKDAWQKLESSKAQPNFFQSYAWCGHTAEVLSRTFPDAYQPLVAIAMRDGEVVAVWPLSRQKRSGIWQLRSLDDPFGQISGMLYADADAAKALVAATLNLVREHKFAAAIRIERVDMDSPLAAALRTCGATVRGQVGAPVLDLTQWPSVEALKASRNKKTMKNLRNATNRLSKAGAHDHTMVTGDVPQIAGIVRATVRQRGAWLDSKGLTSPQFRSLAHEDILGGGQAWGLDKLRAGFELKCADNVIAQQWGFIHDKRYYAYMSATDPQAVLFSPGRLHLSFVISDAMRTGVEAIEMLTPASDYKLVWTDSVRTLCDMAMPISFVGKVHNVVWERTVRRVMKAAFYALPVALRRHAVPREDAAVRDTET